MGLLDVHLDPLGITTPILILAVAAGHAIQVLKRYYEEYNRLQGAGMPMREANREAVVESIARVGPVMVTACSIAILTFFSLATNGISAVQHFGVFAGCGVLATMILEMTLIPVLRSVLRPPKKRETARERKAGIVDRLLLGLANNLVGGRAPWIVAGGLAVLALVGVGLLFVRVDNNFKLYFKPMSTVRVDDRVLNEQLRRHRFAAVSGPDPSTRWRQRPQGLAGHGRPAGIPGKSAGCGQDAVAGGSDQNA